MLDSELKLKGFTFQELFSMEGLLRLDSEFLSYLYAADELLHDQLLA